MTQVYTFKVIDQYNSEYCAECFKNGIHSQNLNHSNHGTTITFSKQELSMILNSLRTQSDENRRDEMANSQEFENLLTKVFNAIPNEGEQY